MKFFWSLPLLLVACTANQEPSPVYAHARWRLATEQELGQTMVYAAHILIRHQAARNDETCFSLADLHSTLPAPNRTRKQARELAERVAEQARAAPEHFAEWSLKYSEDIVRRQHGGSLGYTTALQLAPWPSLKSCTLAPSHIPRILPR